MGDGNRLMAFWPRFQLAAQVMGTWFVAVLVAQVDFDTGQVFFITFERALNSCTYPLLQSLTALNMVIAVDLDLHSSSLISASSPEAFSVALSVGSRLPGVTWHSALWSPDFPPPAAHTTKSCGTKTGSVFFLCTDRDV